MDPLDPWTLAAKSATKSGQIGHEVPFRALSPEITVRIAPETALCWFSE
jgi:hypothetical protein